VGVAVAPGDFFGPRSGSHVRLCFATSEEGIEDGVDRLRRFFERTGHAVD
jgi:aspartate/methionine/tyrosine aminotransferase